MRRRAIASPGFIILILVLQFIPLLLFPSESFSPASQEWWLPVLLAVMVIIADVQIILRRSPQAWPWYLMSFAQGFNIISRIMMLWPHATEIVNKVQVLNMPYIMLTLLAMVLSVFLLWYTELPEVRLGLLEQS